VFAGVILLGTETRDDWRRKYAKVETDVRKATMQEGELKASTLSNKYKNKIFRSLNGCHKFAVIVEQWRVNSNIWKSKKDKQRYLDFVYKIAIKRAFNDMIESGVVIPKDVENIYFFVDEHTTATNGRYELEEGLLQELKSGTFNFNYSLYFPPIFPDVKTVKLDYLNSAAPANRLVRASDIIANYVLHLAETENIEKLSKICNMYYIIQP
jgi:hypothetical protein